MAVYKDSKTNTWRAVYRYTDWTGKKKQTQKRGFITKKEAQAWEREQLNKAKADLDMTLESFVGIYIEDMKARLRENTWLTKEHILRTKILPYFKNRKMCDIQPKDIMAWQNRMMNMEHNGNKYSPVYLKTVHNQISALFNHAVKFYGLSSNPAAKVGNMGKEKNKEMLIWTQEEYKKFSEAIMDKPISFYAFEVLYWCGLREGELLALTPNDIDFDKKTISMAQLAYHVSKGKELWGYEVRKGTVLYLALEDDYRRLQERLYRMFGEESTENLFLSVTAGQLGNGLDEQLTGFITEHQDTKLIIIDTLQKIREFGGDKYSYSNDYEVITRLKNFTDNYGVCLLLVHHTRKQQADDKFDMISGTNGLLGAADGAFMLQKEKRTSNAAVLEISGRDQQDQKLYLVRDTERLLWNLEKIETELWKEPPEPILEAVAKFITADNPQWVGSPTELVKRLGVDMQANVLTLKLNVNAGRLRNEYGIRYENKRCHEGRRVRLSLAENKVL